MGPKSMEKVPMLAEGYEKLTADLKVLRAERPLVVDAIGWNIQIRTTHLDYRPPYPEDLQEGEVGVGKRADQEAGYRNVIWHPASSPGKKQV